MSLLFSVDRDKNPQLLSAKSHKPVNLLVALHPNDHFNDRRERFKFISKVVAFVFRAFQSRYLVWPIAPDQAGDLSKPWDCHGQKQTTTSLAAHGHT